MLIENFFAVLASKKSVMLNYVSLFSKVAFEAVYVFWHFRDSQNLRETLKTENIYTLLTGERVYYYGNSECQPKGK